MVMLKNANQNGDNDFQLKVSKTSVQKKLKISIKTLKKKKI